MQIFGTCVNEYLMIFNGEIFLLAVANELHLPSFTVSLYQPGILLLILFVGNVLTNVSLRYQLYVLMGPLLYAFPAPAKLIASPLHIILSPGKISAVGISMTGIEK